jgi:sec-independent protein translocase protein TatC
MGIEVPTRLRRRCRRGDARGVAGVGNYLSFVTRFLFGFGVAFLLPILLMVLERAGLVTREQLAAKRRYAIVGAFAVAAVLTPPDAVSQFMLAIPLCLLYESAIIAIRVTHSTSDVSEPQTSLSSEAPPGA